MTKFRDQFPSAVNNKTNMINVYLFKNALKEDILETLTSLTLTNENYDAALKF